MPTTPSEPTTPPESSLVETAATSRTRLVRRTARPLGVGVLALALVWAAGSWYFAGQIHRDALAVTERTPLTPDVPVAAVREDSIALARVDGAPDALTRPGTWGLRWDSGYGQVTRIVEETDRRVVRRFRVLTGSAPAVGDRVAVDKAAFGENPSEVLGLGHRSVTYASPRGQFPAWFVPGDGDTWAVLVHGRQAPRREMLRLLRTVHGAGLPALVPAYRNDPEAAPDPSGEHRFGETEWRDAEAAVQYALDHGAEDVVLVGASMGGAIVTELTDRSDTARAVSGVVLDGPLLDLEAAVDDAASRRTVPLTPLPLPPGLDETAAWVAEQRYDVDLDDFDHTDEAVAMDVPLLLLHGTADETAPVGVSDDVAAAREDAGRTTTYVRVDGATHVGEWNHAPRRVDRAVDDFLTSLD